MKKHFTSYILITILGVVINAPFSFSQTNISLSMVLRYPIRVVI